MNFFKNLFTFLFHKNHILTKKIHSLGAVIVTTCMISLFILGVNGFASTIYAATNQEEQALIVADTQSQEIDELVANEEEMVQQLVERLDDKWIQSYLNYQAIRLNELQVEKKTLQVMGKESPQLSKQSNEEKENFVTVSEKDVNVTPNRDPIKLTQSDYEILLRIVEAEVGTEDLYTRMMIANVIINRMKHDYYPNNIEEVVFQNDGKVYQFSPILDGRFYEVNISNKTIEAVNNALAGYDNSQGALAFVNRAITSDKVMEWFDNNLIFVTKYNKVEYFTF